MVVWGIVPGADVTLEVDGAQQTLKINSTATTFTVGSLAAGAKVRARQQVGADTSDWSNIITVEDVRLPPELPAIEPKIPRCSECITAWGAAPGSHIEITHEGMMIAEGEVNRDGWCCMGTKNMPSSTMESAINTCGQNSPANGYIDAYNLPSPLQPPVINTPVFECQNRIEFSGLVPGARVEVSVTDLAGTTSSLGTFCACSSNVRAYVGRSMKKGDSLKAIQSMPRADWDCNVKGTGSAEVPVVPPDARIKPQIVTPLYAGEPVILVANQIDNGMITLLSRASSQAQEEDLGSRPSSTESLEVPVPNPPLIAGQILRVAQELCGVTEFSDPVEVQGPPPAIDRPAVRKPLYGCGQVVAVDNVLPGAWVYIRQTPPNSMSPEYLIGKTKALSTSVVASVYPLLQAGSSVTAYQEVGGRLSDRADWVTVKHKTEFPAPTVVPPVIVGSKYVWLNKVVPGAYIRIFNNGVQMGSGSLPDTDGMVGLWWAIPEGAILTATQALCQYESRPSPKEPSTSGTPCEGPPKFDPGKWNDGGKIQGCNNCYNYACDIRTDTFAQPGGSSQNNCEDVIKGALSDGLQLCAAGYCHPCHHRVALVMNPGEDYHWYRQDADGTWSHKRGCSPAKNVDESEEPKPIFDLTLANRGPYTVICGYFCVYKPKVKISGPGTKKCGQNC